MTVMRAIPPVCREVLAARQKQIVARKRAWEGFPVEVDKGVMEMWEWK
jgi:hypothetical protein